MKTYKVSALMVAALLAVTSVSYAAPEAKLTAKAPVAAAKVETKKVETKKVETKKEAHSKK